MLMNAKLKPAAVLTAAFGLCAVFAGTQTSPAAPMHKMKKPMSSAAQVTTGKGISESSGCNTCHGATYTGKKGFSPSIRASGVTKKYTLTKFERMMNTGETEDGGHVKKPMPVYHMPVAKSAPLYKFLMAQK
jgi:cytochrome c553